MADTTEKLLWKVVAGLAGAGAAMVTRNALEKAWSSIAGGDPPSNPESPETNWREAIIWAVSTGVFVSIARLVAERTAAHGWVRATGSLPPGLETVS